MREREKKTRKRKKNERKERKKKREREEEKEEEKKKTKKKIPHNKLNARKEHPINRTPCSHTNPTIGSSPSSPLQKNKTTSPKPQKPINNPNSDKYEGVGVPNKPLDSKGDKLSVPFLRRDE